MKHITTVQYGTNKDLKKPTGICVLPKRGQQKQVNGLDQTAANLEADEILQLRFFI